MSQKRIMVVEDDKDIRRGMKRLLESEGYNVEVAEHGQHALDLLHASTELPHLILLDLMMPVMDGFQFRTEQAQHERLAQIPVAILTADGHIDEKQMRSGAIAALRKPADADAIIQLIQKIIN